MGKEGVARHERDGCEMDQGWRRVFRLCVAAVLLSNRSEDRLMPYVQPATMSLPYQDDPADRSGNTSRAGAEAISGDANYLRARYTRLLSRRGITGATDEEAARELGIQRTTVIPRRHELGAHVAWSGQKRVNCPRAGGRRVPNKVWVLAVFVGAVESTHAREVV